MKVRSLRVFLLVLGVVMVVAGLSTVLLGARMWPREEVVGPDMDSEMRFYAVWYAALGVLLLRSRARLDEAREVVRVVGVCFFVAGCARVLSWVVVGRPHPFTITLMVIELTLPWVLIPWHAAALKERPA